MPIIRRTLLLCVVSSLIISGCGFSSSGSNAGIENVMSGGGTSGTGSAGGKAGSSFSGAGGVSGTNDSVIATPSVAGTVSVLTGANQTVSIVFTSSDGRPTTGFAITGSLGALPAGWSGPSSFVCASVSTGNDCVLNLTFAPTAAGSGMLTLPYEFVDNAAQPRTEFFLTIPYIATAHNNVLAAATPSGQINAVAGAGSQTVSINFTTDDGNAATSVALNTDLTALPPGWTSTATSFSCAVVSTGSGCELTLTYAPTAAGGGTLELNYSYVDDTDSPGTGSINIPYSSTPQSNVAAIALPAGQINAIEKTGGQVVDVAFTTDDGKRASNLFVTSDLKTLPAGWSSTAGTFSCGSVSTGNGCLLPLKYAPTALTSGTLTLDYVYDDDSGAAKGGLLNVTYAATTNDNVVGTASPVGQINAIVSEVSPSLSITFTTDDGRQATALQLTTSLASGLPAGWTSTDTSFSCTALSSGDDCQLPLMYAPTAPASGTLMLGYSYLNNDNLPKTGTVNVAYRATSDNSVAGYPNQTSLNVVTGDPPSTVTVTFVTSDGERRHALSADSHLRADGAHHGYAGTRPRVHLYEQFRDSENLDHLCGRLHGRGAASPVAVSEPISLARADLAGPRSRSRLCQRVRTCAKPITSPAIISSIWAIRGARQLPSSSKTFSAVLIAAPSGVGQPRKACTMSRSAPKVFTAPGQPPAVAMQPTARPLK